MVEIKTNTLCLYYNKMIYLMMSADSIKQFLSIVTSFTVKIYATFLRSSDSHYIQVVPIMLSIRQ
jgi:hypothetical protein